VSRAIAAPVPTISSFDDRAYGDPTGGYQLRGQSRKSLLSSNIGV